MDKKFALYIAKTVAHRRIVRGVVNQFEAANVKPWVDRVHAAQTVRAVNRIVAEFEEVDKA